MPLPIPTRSNPAPQHGSSDTTVAVSFILATRGRTAQLVEALQVWIHVQSRATWELIVVDNNADDQTWDVLQEWRDRLPMRMIRERRPGVTGARNAGFVVTTGTIVAVIDDDCYPAPSLVDAWIDVFADEHVDFAVGRIELFDPDDLPITIKTATEPAWYPPFRFIPPGELHSASMAFRREIFVDVGPFDLDLGPGSPFRSGDDTELFQRASLLGYTGRYSPEALIWHHHRRRAADYAGLQRSYDLGAGAAYACIALLLPGAVLRLCRDAMGRAGGSVPWAKQVFWDTRGRHGGSLLVMAGAALRFSLVLARRGWRRPTWHNPAWDRHL